MNERIKELAEQAGYTPLEPRTFADDLQEIFLQKFAELIVKECASICKESGWVPAVLVSDDILLHFGIEE